MLIRLRGWGLALLAAGSLGTVSTGQAQDNIDTDPLPLTPQAKTDSQLSIEERVMKRNRNRDKNQRVEDGDYFKKHPPVWSLKDVTKEHHPYASPSSPAPGGGHYPGGPTGRFGQPYYYSATSPDTSGMGGGGAGLMGGPVPSGGFGYPGGHQIDMGAYPMTGGYPNMGGMTLDPGFGYGDYGSVGSGYGGMGGGGGYGYGTGGGSSYAAQPGQLPGDPYHYHFGPGYYRQQEAGHYRFPYFSYRRPWYFPGHPSYNRDTNIPW